MYERLKIGPLYFFAQIADVDIQKIAVTSPGVTPNGVQNLLTRQSLIGKAEQASVNCSRSPQQSRQGYPRRSSPS